MTLSLSWFLLGRPVSKNCRYCSIASITPVCSRQGASLRVLGCLMFHSKRSVRTTERGLMAFAAPSGPLRCQELAEQQAALIVRTIRVTRSRQKLVFRFQRNVASPV